MRALLRVTILSCLLVLSVSPLFAQYALWEPEEGVDLRREHFFDVDYLSITGDGDGHALIVWVDRYRNQVADIHAQLVDTNGDLLWEDGGIYVAGNDISQMMPAVTSTGDGEWIIVYVSGFSEEYDTEIHAQKVDLNGDRLWGDGVVVCDAPGYQVFPSILADADGDGVVIAWEDWREQQPLPESGTGALALYCQHLDGNGEPSWEENGVAAFGNYTMDYWVSSKPHSSLISDGSGGVIVGLASNRFQRLMSDGQRVWNTGVELYNVGSATSDGSGGLIAIRYDQRHGGGSRLNYINNSGELIIEDSLFAPDLGCREIFRGPDSQYFVVFGEHVVTIQSFQLADNAFQTLDENSLEYLADHNGQCIGDVNIQQGRQGNIACFYRFSTDDPFGLCAHSIFYSYQDIAADTVYGGIGGILVDSEMDSKSELAFCEMDDDYLGAVWFCWEDDYCTIKTKVMPTTEPYDPGETAQLVISGMQRNVSWPTMIRSDKNIYVAWDDESSRLGFARVQRINPETGDLLWGELGVQLFDDMDILDNDTLHVPQYHVEITPDGAGGLYVAFINSLIGQDPRRELRLQRCDPDGNLLFGDTGVLISNDIQADPTWFSFALHPDGGGYILYHSQGNLVLQRFDDEGAILWESGAILAEHFIHIRSFMHTLEDGSVLCVYADCHLNPTIYANRISESGESLWNEPVLIGESGLSTDTYFDCKVVDGDAVVIVYPNRSEDGHALFASIVTSDGDLLLGENGVETISLPDINCIFYDYCTSDVCATEDGFWVAGATMTQSLLQRFDLNGEPVTGQIVLPQIENITIAGKLTLLPDGQNGVYVLWGDEDQGIIRMGSFWIHVLSDGSYVHPEYETTGNVISLLQSRDMRRGGLDQEHYDFTAVPDDDGGFIVAWTSYHFDYFDRTEGISLYAQRFMDDWQEEHVEQIVEQPLEFALESVYPNPFNPLTRIGYTLPSAGHVTLTVYDVLGREVARLLDGPMSAGRHTVVWDTHGSMASSGTYFCRLEKDGQTAIQKLVLVK